MGEKFVVTFTRAAEIDGYVEGKFTATGVSIRTRPSEGGSYIVTLSNATISDGTFSSRRLVDEFPPLIP
jgi:hypothetical protein